MASFSHRSTPSEDPDDGSGRVALAGLFVVLIILIAGVGILAR